MRDTLELNILSISKLIDTMELNLNKDLITLCAFGHINFKTCRIPSLSVLHISLEIIKGTLGC